ncbi:hypothetical protein HC823_02480, partial [Candidatus Gracilibacteria bacterium]|nr:hypothetical protein [Candidatus Gracilibacteria bacterium]
MERLGRFLDRSAYITDTSGVSTADEALNYWDTLLSQFFKGTTGGTLGTILDRATVWKTDSEITTIDTGQTATENLLYWDSTNDRYCKGLSTGALECWANCVPNCVNKSCGDDGCGGSCGVCLGTCTAGVCTVPAPTTQLLAYYPFDGSSNDISTNLFHGTNSGATDTADRDANATSAFDFDGVNDTVNTPIDETDLAANNGRDFSVAVWVRSEGWGTCPNTNNCAYNKVIASNRSGTCSSAAPRPRPRERFVALLRAGRRGCSIRS